MFDKELFHTIPCPGLTGDFLYLILLVIMGILIELKYSVSIKGIRLRFTAREFKETFMVLILTDKASHLKLIIGSFEG